MANKWASGLSNAKGSPPTGNKDKPAAAPLSDWLKKMYEKVAANTQNNYLTAGKMQTDPNYQAGQGFGRQLQQIGAKVSANMQNNYLTAGKMQADPMYQAGKVVGKGIQQGVANLSYQSPQQQQRMEAIREKQRQDALRVYNTGIAPANQYDLSGLTPEQKAAFYRAPGFALTLPADQQAQVFGVDTQREPILPGQYDLSVPTLDGTNSGDGILRGYRHGSDYDPYENYRGYQPPGILPMNTPGLTPPPANEIPTYEYPYYGYGGNGGYGGQQRPDVNQWYANMVNWTINRPQGG